ncbi:OsmC family protein [Rhodohalobacter halophilus]|uniref:OsmC family protein n=1 Tax=Rhodohalobacter halophilus TaxID=1812810 RepID=UPI00083F5A2D|nr:OsmC family protein [Rhodohalobacter halophilus]
MATYCAEIKWERNGAPFQQSDYSRVHRWLFDGGDVIKATASLHIVPEPHAIPNAVDPEEAFIASISSCHMLWFLAIASRKGFVVDSYSDCAEGVMEKNEKGELAITNVDLHPVVSYSPEKVPDTESDQKMHQEAHQKCFIANSVKSEIRIYSKIEVS